MLRRPFARAAMLALALMTSVVALMGAACDGGESEAPYTYELVSNRGPYAVGVTTLELVDERRSTEPNGDVPGSPPRKLTVEVWYPASANGSSAETRDAPLDDRGAPYPLVVFAHGLSGTRRQSASFAQHLASHGYLVASPDFPLSNLATPGGPRLLGVLQQPGDVSFIVDSLLAKAETEGDRFAGAIDGDAVAVSGHSLGGLTALLTVYGPHRDDRMKAALAFAPPACFLTSDVVGLTSVPVMVMGGSLDLIVNRSSYRNGYDVARPPKYYVELVGGNHISFADLDIGDEVGAAALSSGRLAPTLVEDAFAVARDIGGSVQTCTARSPTPDDPRMAGDRQRELARAFAVAFFDAYVRGNDRALAFLQEELPSLVTDARVEYEAD
ncbi:MAG TPA: dienelactone hydrolase family protein [Dehalococcoidia bacterium]|nr:dienelactone hydrolase family protein [Dehalococcoidia bacterium]